MTPGISRPDRLRIAARATCDERSVGAAYSGRPVRQATIDRVTRAARDLGLPPPSSSSTE